MTARRTIAAAAIVCAVVAVGPVPGGGALTAVTVRGSSMHPSIVAGDLVVVMRRSHYRVGDVIAYRSPDTRVIVLHRIVDRIGDRFVTRGDANDFDDDARPATDQVMGRLVGRIPRGERYVRPTAVGVAGLALVAASPSLRVTPRLRRGGRRR